MIETPNRSLVSEPWSQKGKLAMTHLTHKHGDASAGKLSDCPGILIQIPTGETLIRAIEESEMTFLCHNVGDCAPLVPCRIHSCGVMGASVEDHDRPVWCGTKPREEATEVQSVRNGVIVRVGLQPEPHSLENRMVVGYGAPQERKTQVDGEDTFEISGK